VPGVNDDEQEEDDENEEEAPLQARAVQKRDRMDSLVRIVVGAVVN